MTLSIALDVLIACLLVAVIVYAVILNRKLGGLREHKAEMEKLLAGFDESTKRAETSVKTLKSSAELQMKALQQPVQRAEAMRDELSFLVKRADELADRLSNGISSARGGEAKAAGQLSEAPHEAAIGAGAADGRRALAARGARPASRAVDESMEPEAEPQEGGRSKAETELLKALRGLR